MLFRGIVFSGSCRFREIVVLGNYRFEEFCVRVSHVRETVFSGNYSFEQLFLRGIAVEPEFVYRFKRLEEIPFSWLSSKSCLLDIRYPIFRIMPLPGFTRKLFPSFYPGKILFTDRNRFSFMLLLISLINHPCMEYEINFPSFATLRIVTLYPHTCIICILFDRGKYCKILKLKGNTLHIYMKDILRWRALKSTIEKLMEGIM